MAGFEVTLHGRFWVTPEDWSILRTPATLDYDYAEVAGKRYLLPKNVDTRVILKNGQRRNQTVFTDYRKFSGDAVVNFETEEKPEP